ncbi:hypothetical protein ACH5RR_022544 [Cinchona calisaya]|uniref:Late blight resistance protein R1A-like N-terminal domain-containing protein n=1 Tax=Cinchona calisaya TaxID=153742 RepID=A0ABD2ZC03_9GENT
MSSRSNTSCFDFVLDYLNWFCEAFRCGYFDHESTNTSDTSDTVLERRCFLNNNLQMGIQLWKGGRLTTDFIDTLLQNLANLLQNLEPYKALEYRGSLRYRVATLETLREKLMFLKSFIGFAILQGVERKQLIDLLIHVEDVALNAKELIFYCGWLRLDDEQQCNKMRVEISQLIHKKINPVDPQVRETYIHVLTVSKLSRSLSQASSGEE